MDLEAEVRGDLLVVRVQQERIDAAAAIEFKDRMRELVDTPAPRVLLDLSRVTFLDSSGLGAVVAVMKLLGPDRRLEPRLWAPSCARCSGSPGWTGSSRSTSG